MKKGNDLPIFRRKPRILFVGADNATHTQMAEAYMRETATDMVDVESAGVKPGTLSATTVLVMQEDNIDIRYNQAVVIDDSILAWADLVVTICEDNAKFPIDIPSSAHHKHWPVAPPDTNGDKETNLQVFRDCRDKIKLRTRNIISAMQLFCRDSQKNIGSRKTAD